MIRKLAINNLKAVEIEKLLSIEKNVDFEIYKDLADKKLRQEYKLIYR